MPRKATVLMLLISYFDEHKYNHLNVLKKYIKRVPKEVHKECDGITPLFLGLLYSDVGMVKILLENGADINKLSQHGTQPLTTTLFFHNEYIMKLLLEYDAYIITKNIDNVKNYNQAIKVIDNIIMLNRKT